MHRVPVGEEKLIVLVVVPVLQMEIRNVYRHSFLILSIHLEPGVDGIVRPELGLIGHGQRVSGAHGSLGPIKGILQRIVIADR